MKTTSRTIAMTEAISREDVANKKLEETANVVPEVKEEKGKAVDLPSRGPGLVDAGPLSPPPPKAKVADGGQTMIAPTAAGPLAPPPPEKKRPLLVGKIIKRKPEEATIDAGAEEPKVLKAKVVESGSTGSRKIPKKLGSHMKTVVMDTKEFAEIPDIAPSSEEEPEEEKEKKRVTKFKIKGPS